MEYYVLPWGQISFWGATVITNLFSAIPYIGEDLVNWIWGGFAVDNPTLVRFYSRSKVEVLEKATIITFIGGSCIQYVHPAVTVCV